MGEFSIWHWAVVLLLVVTIFGTKKLRNVGSDLGTAIRQFKKALHEGEDAPTGEPAPRPAVANEAVHTARAGEDARPPTGA